MTPISPDVILHIALDAPLDQLFDYLAPGATEADIGRRVTVPFGRQKKVGVAVALSAHTDVPAANLKTVQSIDRTTQPLPADLIQLAQFAAQYYRHPLGAVLTSLLPPALRRTDLTHRTDTPRRSTPPAAYQLTPEGLQHTATLPARAFAQRALAEKLVAGQCLHAELNTQEKSLLRDWLKKGWAVGDAAPRQSPQAAIPAPELSSEQQAALAEISAQAGFTPWLLHGVTGSGKTEIYLHCVQTVLAAKQQALILVPEIHLTPQLTERFARRFPNQRLLSLHSGLADGERRNAWLDAMAGEADIVLGTRLAVFTPMPRLGLIVVDEEHDTAFKQMEGMRYSARDVAVWRAKQRNVPIILGSATPALESWRNAREGRYKLLSLTHRARSNAVLPSVRLVDSRTDRPRNGITQTLLNALKQRLERGEQSLVFINRRGYAPTLLCNACGHVFPCPRCSAHLVLHQGRRAGGHANPQTYQLLCHHCGLVTRPPDVCPDCGNVDLRPAGQGTQRVEETLSELFPDARLLRIDRDTAARKGAFAAMREQVEAREVDILIGTQIVAKGHDFPHLTLVGVIGADQALVSPDFRAGERVFSQLMQVAGRAGRADHPGEVLIQTAFPQHPLYQAVAAHDYPGYAKQALRERRGADFPPYASQVLLRAEGRDEQAVLAFLHAARNIGETFNTRANVLIFDPVAALMSRVANRHRMQLLAQSAARAHLQKFLDFWVPKLRELSANGVRWGLDVDPLDV